MEIIELKQTQNQDVCELVKISKSAFDSDVSVGATQAGGPPGYDSEKWHLQMMNFGKMFTAFADDKIVGGAIVFPDKNKSEICVGRIFISPDCFCKGYGTLVMQKLEEEFSDIHTWNLDTPLWNVRTNKFYVKLGYVETSRDNESVFYTKTI